MTYNLKDAVAILSTGFAKQAQLVRDKEMSEEDLRAYFINSFNIFMTRLEELRANDTLSPQSEKELRFMLEALFSAKHILIEK